MHPCNAVSIHWVTIWHVMFCNVVVLCPCIHIYAQQNEQWMMFQAVILSPPSRLLLSSSFKVTFDSSSMSTFAQDACILTSVRFGWSKDFFKVIVSMPVASPTKKNGKGTSTQNHNRSTTNTQSQSTSNRRYGLAVAAAMRQSLPTKPTERRRRLTKKSLLQPPTLR